MEHEILTRVALRYQALFVDINREEIDMTCASTPQVIAFVAQLKEIGYCVSEELLHALCRTDSDTLQSTTDIMNDVMGVNLNWVPLVKGWTEPTGESRIDHIITLFVNIVAGNDNSMGTRLKCGHLIPNGTFPLDRYNGCPFCGTPFETSTAIYKGTSDKLKELRLFTRQDLLHVFTTLLSSSIPLDATQKASLQNLLIVFPMPDHVEIEMKGTMMLVAHQLFALNKTDEAKNFFKTPTDVLRYLWYEKTGYIRIIQPRTLISQARRFYAHMFGPLNQSSSAAQDMKTKLRLKYNRKVCRQMAELINNLPMSAELATETMNSKRAMWVRFIRALRLGEYSRRKGFEHLAAILDLFYKQNYTTWQGHIDELQRKHDVERSLVTLKQKPGMFARCLLSTMLRYGSTVTLNAFGEVAEKVPARLLLSLSDTASIYFDLEGVRLAHPVTGTLHALSPNPLLYRYNTDERNAMMRDIKELFKCSMRKRFSLIENPHKKMFIDPQLFDIPLGVGDRTLTVQDTSCALQGTRFRVRGNAVRLFLQWGKGLHAQHLDMDLSCYITFEDKKTEACAFYNLVATGAYHSGDIRSIPEMVGTAEYILLDIAKLKKAKAKYVIFTCNAYSCVALSPNLVVGWMNSVYPMSVSEETGVAYNPACVQHMVKVGTENLAKGLVFGVLSIATREITWLEMPFTSQTICGCNTTTVEALLRRVRSKISIGELLNVKAEAQGLELVNVMNDADEVYPFEWALNTAEVSNLLSC